MAGVQRTPPKIQATSLSQTQTQSEPDINSAVTMSGYVNTNRKKRFRKGDSPQGEDAISSLDAGDYDQGPCVSKTLAVQTTLMNKLLSDIGEIKSQNIQIQASNAEIRKTNEKIVESMSFMNKQFEDMKNQVEDLRKERLLQKQYIENLEKKILDLQHKSRSSGIEIRNIPQDDTETSTSLLKTVCTIGDVVGVPIRESGIRDVYRLPGKAASPTTPRPIIAEFSAVQTKQSLLSAVRAYNKEKGKEDKVNTTLIGIPGKTQPVYIAEQLPATTKKLFYQAREFAKNKDYKYCWLSTGNIFLRKIEGDKQVLIHSEKCLHDLGNLNM